MQEKRGEGPKKDERGTREDEKRKEWNGMG